MSKKEGHRLRHHSATVHERMNALCVVQEIIEWRGDPAHNMNINSNLVPFIKDLGHPGPFTPSITLTIEPKPNNTW